MGYLDTVNADGSYNLRVIMQIAVLKTRAEVEGFNRIGRPMTFKCLFPGELKKVWGSAQNIRASWEAGRENSKFSPLERRARRLELQAEIAEGAIPSRREEARDLRSRALRLRLEASVEQLIAAE